MWTCCSLSEYSSFYLHSWILLPRFNHGEEVPYCKTPAFFRYRILPPSQDSNKSYTKMLLHIFLSISPFLITQSAPAPAPAPQGVTDPCNILPIYTDFTESAAFLGSWSMTGASAVTSNSEPANLQATYSESVGTTITVGVELGADL